MTCCNGNCNQGRDCPLRKGNKMKLLKAFGFYALAVPVFVQTWMQEQRHALVMAFLHSFSPAHDHVKKLFEE